MIKRIFASFFALLTALLPFGKAPEPKCEARFNGTFIQSWYCLWWDDARWQQEIDNMKKTGVEYLIVQTVASFSDENTAVLHYPSELSCFENCEKYGDVIGDALKACRGSGIKVFIGLADFESWWTYGGLTKEYDAVCDKMALMMEEIYEKYAAEYGDTLYGWYFTPEISNAPVMKLSILSIAGGLNKVIDKANELNPSMPVLLSPYFECYSSLLSAPAALPEWQAFMQAVHFRDGDIFCPQDAVGAGWVQMKDLEKAWKMYAAAVTSCEKDIRLWANCECMTVARADGSLLFPATPETEDVTATLDRFTEQMEIASRYAENIIVFSFNHYYCSDEVNPVYWNTYLDYLENGTLETNAPTAPENVTLENGALTWNAANDDIGVACYLVTVNGKLSVRVEADRELSVQIEETTRSCGVTAVDGAGNKSETVSVQVSAPVC